MPNEIVVITDDAPAETLEDTVDELTDTITDVVESSNETIETVVEELTDAIEDVIEELHDDEAEEIVDEMALLREAIVTIDQRLSRLEVTEALEDIQAEPEPEPEIVEIIPDVEPESKRGRWHKFWWGDSPPS